MDSNILLSIIIPVFNSQHTLAKCLDSILNQSYTDYEIVIVNDGSTDGSQQIIDQYVTQYPSIIKFVTKVNGGIGSARNLGIANANGQYLGFVDSDDYVESNYFTVIEKIIKSKEPDIFIFSYKRVYHRKPSFLEKRYSFSKNEIVDTIVNIDSHPQIICQTENGVCLKIIKRDIVCKNQNFLFSNLMLGEDLEVSFKWYLKAKKVIFSKEQLYNYVIQNSSLNTSTQHITDFFSVMKSVCEEYKLQGKFESCYAELEILFTKHLLISNMRRMKSSTMKNKQDLFLSLRTELMKYFPNFNSNLYLKQEPFYVRLAVFLSWYFPSIFRFIL